MTSIYIRVMATSRFKGEHNGELLFVFVNM